MQPTTAHQYTFLNQYLPDMSGRCAFLLYRVVPHDNRSADLAEEGLNMFCDKSYPC